MFAEDEAMAISDVSIPTYKWTDKSKKVEMPVIKASVICLKVKSRTVFEKNLETDDITETGKEAKELFEKTKGD